MYRDFQSDPFLITADPLENPENYFENSQIMSTAFVYYDDKTKINRFESNSYEIMIIGYVLDISDGRKNPHQIMEEIHRQHTRSFESLLDYIDLLNGRFIIILDDGSDTKVFTDATSSRPIFYWEKQVFGSHESMVKEIVQTEKEINLPANPKMNGYLDYSNTKDIFKFNPNMYFSFKDGRFIRYFPRENFDPMTLEQAGKEAAAFFRQQVMWLDLNYGKLYFSLTGGLDSKVSLALIKPLKDKTEFFTYMIDLDKAPEGERKSIYAKDEVLVQRIASDLDLNHKVYYLKNYKPPEEYLKKLTPNVSSHHSLALSYMMAQEFKDEGIHIKSTIYEMAKLPYPVKTDFTRDLNEVFSYGKRWEPKTLRTKKAYGRQLFDDFIERSDFLKIDELGHNMPLFLYWETRMANWHSNITQETDNILETFIFINSRHLFNNFIRLNVEDRQQKLFLSNIIDHFWPILNYHVPNSYQTLKEVAESKPASGAAEHNITIESLNNMDIRFESDGVILKPAAGVNTKADDISFIIKNDKDFELGIRLQGFYSHPRKNIFIVMNEQKYSINSFKAGKEITLSPGQEVEIQYAYTREFKRESWLEAGRIKLSEI